jgi:hypothetical protein
VRPRSLRPIFGSLALATTLLVPAAQPDPVLVWHALREVAAGQGVRGPWQQNESRYDYVDDPTVAVDARGDVVVAWVEQGRKDVFLQRFAAGEASPRYAPVNVSRSPATFSWLPRIALAPQAPHQVFVLWQEIIFSGGSHGGDIVFARSGDGGQTFSTPVNLSSSVGGDGKGRINRDYWDNGSLDLAAGAGGAVVVAWTEYAGTLWFSRSTDAGQRFTRAQPLARGNSAKPARAPSLALGPDGTVHLAWTVGEDESADIHLATSRDGGATFEAPRVVAHTRGYSDAPRLAVDARGTVHLVHSESAGGPFERSHIRYTRSVDGGRTFEPAREISSPSAAGFSSAGAPALSTDAKGRVYVSWELFRHRHQRPRALGFAVSIDGGQRFGAPIVVPGSTDPAGGENGSQQGLLMNKLAVNDSGVVAIVNSSLAPGVRSRVWLTRAQMTAARN